MATQVYWEDVQEGDEIPQLKKNCSTQQLVLWAAASGDFYQIHYDQDFARATGLKGIIVHGALKNAFLGQLLHDWAGEGLVDLDIWTENPEGQKTSPGTATVALPSRG